MIYPRSNIVPVIYNVQNIHIHSFFSITSARFKQLAEEINDIFIHEAPELYYVPYVKNEVGQPKAARGKLISTYRYIKRSLKVLDLIPSSTSKTSRKEKFKKQVKLIVS